MAGAGTTATHTLATAIILMGMVAPTATVVVAATVTGTTTLTAETSMVTATGVIMVTDTATPADPESPSCNGGCRGLAIIMDPLTESWGRKRGAQSGRTSKTTITQVNRRRSGHAERSRSRNNLSVDWPAVS